MNQQMGVTLATPAMIDMSILAESQTEFGKPAEIVAYNSSTIPAASIDAKSYT